MYIYNCERMKLPSCPRTLIINTLRKNPEGLTLTSIAELAGLHRHTATKYIYELKGAGVINERDVGSAKLCCLKDGFSKEEQKKLVERLNGTVKSNERVKASKDAFHRKSSTGQVQILTLFMFLFLVPASIIIAQNATQSSNFTGELILDQVNISNEQMNVPSDNQTSEISNWSMFTEILNETQNQTVLQEDNNETQENLTELNVTISNETAEIPDTEKNIQENPPNEITENETVPEIFQPVLSVTISSQDKALRGEQFDVSAIISNTGNSEAKNVRLEWILSEGIDILSGESSANCGTISPDSECMSSITLSTPMSAVIGKSEIRVVVKYEE